MMNLEVTKEDLSFIKMLVSKAEVENIYEIHHARSFEYKDYLRMRTKQIDQLLSRVKTLLPDEN